MVPNLPHADIPTWLRDIGVDSRGRITTPFRATTVLDASVYYPASGLDGNPLERFGAHWASFVYVDYEARYDVASVRLDMSSVRGYRVLGERLLAPDEADVAAWTHASGRGARLGKPFALWTILERTPDRDDRHGPPRISLLFLCADGVATYEGLYTANLIAPEVVVLVHPGTAFGGNWTDFADPQGPLCQAIVGQGRRAPRYLCSHTGPSGGAPWPAFRDHVATLHGPADIHLWRRPER